MRCQCAHKFISVYIYICVCVSQLQSCQAEDIKEDYDTGKDGTTMVSFKVDFDQVDKLEDAIKSNCKRDLVFFKNLANGGQLGKNIIQ